MTDAAFLMDSNIAIYILSDGGCGAAKRLVTMTVGSVVTSAISYAEVMRGIPSDEHDAIASAIRLFDRTPVLPFNADAAIAYSRLPFKRARFDRLIAAHALALGLVLITNNESDFADIPGLKIENWTRA